MVLWRCFYPPLHASILKWIQSSYKKHRYQRCSIYIDSVCKSIFSEGQMYLSSKLLCFKLWLLNTHLASLFMPSSCMSQRMGFSIVVCWHKHIEIQISKAHCYSFTNCFMFHEMMPFIMDLIVMTYYCYYEKSID